MGETKKISPHYEYSIGLGPDCPYCGYSDDDWWESLSDAQDGDSWGDQCEKCGRTFQARVTISHIFETKPFTDDIGMILSSIMKLALI
jgi:hypothetical protein